MRIPAMPLDSHIQHNSMRRLSMHALQDYFCRGKKTMTNPTLAADLLRAAEIVAAYLRPHTVCECQLCKLAEDREALAARLRAAALSATEGAEAVNLMGQYRAERNDLQSKLNHANDEIESLRSVPPRPQMTEAVKVPHDMKEWPNAKQAEKSYVCGWNDCCKEVLRLNGVKP